ncbi:MAG: hypothetical protein HY800_03275 [Ignavibacteriales bacterium]|nr:hypothetical protein [Ignavibacteriales bacterium]
MKSLILLLITINIGFGQTFRGENPERAFESKFKNDLCPVELFPSHTTYETDGEKSVTLAALYSFLIPGMGEMYVGNYSKGKYFTIAEGLLWITLIGFDRYGTWVQNDARDFATQHAGVMAAGKSDDYFVDIGDYQSIWEYNEDMLRNRQPYKMYDEYSSMTWNWDSKSNREYYRDLRVSSDQAFNNVSFVAAAIGVNHLVSAINAAMSAKSHNNNLQQSSLLDIHANVQGGIMNPHGIMISFSKTC